MQTPVAFDLICQLALKQGLAPIKDRVVVVTLPGYEIKMNGCATDQQGIAPFNALVMHNILGPIAMVGPDGGNVLGEGNNEDELIEALIEAVMNGVA